MTRLCLSDSESRQALTGRVLVVRSAHPNLRQIGPALWQAPGGAWVPSPLPYAPWRPGDVLPAREAWAQPGTVARSDDPLSPDRPVVYRADDPRSYSWRSPVTMPAWAVRHHLQVVRIECRLAGSLTEEEARETGCAPDRYATEESGHLTHAYRRGAARDWARRRGRQLLSPDGFAWFSWMVSSGAPGTGADG